MKWSLSLWSELEKNLSSIIPFNLVVELARWNLKYSRRLYTDVQVAVDKEMLKVQSIFFFFF